MTTTTSVRLPAELTEGLDHLARDRGTTRSELIRLAIEAFVEAARAGGPADRVALLRAIVTYPGSGRGDLATRSAHHLRKTFDARRRRPR
jgi:metal-responsive CopG/Arc/MetJ family transcriptional regulator